MVGLSIVRSRVRLPNKFKKWFMLQFWRIQQVAQILTLVLLGVTDSILLWGKIQWRGGIISNPYVGPMIILLSIALVIWFFAIFWDLRLKMWREQTSVLIEKNPYMKERMAPKEIAIYAMTWIPVMEHLGKDDPVLKVYADELKDWLKREMKEDKLAPRDLEDILRHMGSERKDLFGLHDKQA